MLNDPTLILNKSWVAVATTTVRIAMVMIYRGHARVIDPETYEVYDFCAWSERPAEGRVIRTVRRAIAVPDVVILSDFDGVPRRSVPFSRRNLYRRDSHRCQYCGRHLPPRKLSVDHVKPRSRGGRTTWENCVLACVPCNVSKGDRPLAVTGMRLLREPSSPRWSPFLEVAEESRRPAWRRFLGELPALESDDFE